MLNSGDPHSDIWFIGEAPGWEEKQKQEPFVGYSGKELTKMLFEAGILRQNCYFTNVTDDRPPSGKIEDLFCKVREAKTLGLEKINGKYPRASLVRDREEILQLIRKYRPKLVVPLGTIALWAITGNIGITAWRGSILDFEGVKVIPTFNPAGVLKNWPWRWVSVQDFKRCVVEAKTTEINRPEYKFIIKPSFERAMDTLQSIKGQLISADIETRAFQIACVGIGWSDVDAICIPFMSIEKDKGYWTEEEEIAITLKLKEVLTDKNTPSIFHNGGYDLQYFARQWGYVPYMTEDTMIMQHLVYPGMQKSLAFISSMYCKYYRYWKDDGKLWNPKTTSEDQYWIYNCTDCVYTYENFKTLKHIVGLYEMREQYELLMRLFYKLLEMMLRGVRIDKAYKGWMGGHLLTEMKERMEWLETVLTHPINPRSSAQMQKLFYGDFKQKAVINRKTQKPTLDDDALVTVTNREPILRPLTEKIQEYRSLGVFKSTFADAELDTDDRLRCMFNITRAKTFRLSSSENAFGTGTNLQTIPSGSEED